MRRRRRPDHEKTLTRGRHSATLRNASASELLATTAVLAECGMKTRSREENIHSTMVPRWEHFFFANISTLLANTGYLKDSQCREAASHNFTRILAD